MNATSLHTPTDHARLEQVGIDPDTVQPRDHEVPCQSCRRPTWNVTARCDAHQPGGAS